MKWYLIFDLSKQFNCEFYCKNTERSVVLSGKFESETQAIEAASRKFYSRPENFVAEAGRYIYTNGRITGLIYGSPKIFDLLYRNRPELSSKPIQLIQEYKKRCVEARTHSANFFTLVPRG